MKKILFSILVLSSIFIYGKNNPKLSDDINTTVGPAYKVVDARIKKYFVFDSTITSIKVHGRTATIQVFSSVNMSESSRRVIKDFPKGFAFEDLLQKNDTLYLFYSVYRKKPEKHFELYVRKVAMKSGAIFSPTKLASSSRKVTLLQGDLVPSNSERFYHENYLLNNRPVKFKVKFSKDKSKVSVFYVLKNKKRNDKKNYVDFGLVLLDGQFNVLNDNEVEFPVVEDSLSILSHEICNNGQFFLLGLRKREHKYQLIEVKKGKELDFKEISIKGSSLMKAPRFFENQQGNLVFTSFAGNGIEMVFGDMGAQNWQFNTNGILYSEITRNGEVLKDVEIEFPVDLIKKYEARRVKKKLDKKEGRGKAGINDLEVVAVKPQKDGSVVIVGEQMYIWRNREIEFNRDFNNNVGGGRTRKRIERTAHFEDIVITKISKDGKVEWMKKLPKRQSSSKSRRGGMGVKFIQSKNFHYLLFLDNIHNLSLNENQVPKGHKDGLGGFLTAYKVDNQTGNWKKIAIFDSRNLKGTKVKQFYTERIFDSIGNNTMFLEIYAKGKKDRLIKMELVK